MSLAYDVDNPSGSTAYHSLESSHKEKVKPTQSGGAPTSLRQNMNISCMRQIRMYKITLLILLLLILLPLLAHRKLLYVS